ncbi:hypothetical protein Q0M94_03570 [Deinococcus radiomollis]|uniref:hypothetical protein n=1 Tax=Deinococcus radiomollis TaxID=468916 RepID=UPI00389122B7
MPIFIDEFGIPRCPCCYRAVRARKVKKESPNQFRLEIREEILRLLKEQPRTTKELQSLTDVSSAVIHQETILLEATGKVVRTLPEPLYVSGVRQPMPFSLTST